MQPATSISEMPPGACDCHMHVYDGPGIVPAPFAIPEANLIRYRALMQRLGLSRVVVVQSMLYANDNRILLSAMDELGDCARGVVVIDPEASDEEIAALDRRGVRGVRAFMLGGGPYAWHDLPTLTERIAPFGWHLQVQMDGRELERASLALSRLPVPVVIDHVGKFLKPVAVDHAGFVALRGLVASGQCWVKLSGMYETSKTGAPDYADVSALASVLIADAPQRLLWGSNWPHPNLQPPPDDFALFAHFASLVPDLAARRRILVDNPAELYRFPPAGEGGT
jgi:D-galactarolactone isomerase